MSFRRTLKAGFIGVPFRKGQHRKGVELAPKYIRESSLRDDLTMLLPKLQVKDYGNIYYQIPKLSHTIEKVNNWSHINACCHALSTRVKLIIEREGMCITMGGDHSIALGTIDGHFKALNGKSGLAVLWIDAHGDIHTNISSPSGNFHGMVLSLLIKELHLLWPKMPGLEWYTPNFSLKNLAYIGLRSLETFEKEIIQKYNITAFGMEDIERYGILSVASMAIQKIDPYSRHSIHVSFDIDALDPLEAPCTGSIVRGGLSLREALIVMEVIRSTRRLHAIDIVEINPTLGDTRDAKITIDAAIEIMLAGLGHKRSKIGDVETKLHLKPTQDIPS